MAYLEIRIAQEIRRFSLDRDHLRIGRLAENDIVLRDGQISRQHAELRFMSGAWRIFDLGSTNGLHYRGRRVREHSFASGDLLLLAPNISLSFRDGAAPPDAIPTAAANGAQVALPARPPIASPAPAMRAPAMPAPYSTPEVPAPPNGSPMFDLLHPRSPFADDEQPYYPPGIGMPAPPTVYNRQYAPGGPAGAPAPFGGQATARSPFEPSMPSVPPSSQSDTIPSGGYPAPAGPMTSGSDGHDPFRRSNPHLKPDAHRATAGPTSTSTSTLLHVCQTCGQLTAPDSVYCQSCHHSIARECSNCRLSLLPIQDRCPRCQTPNPGSVRRAHRATGA